jgi:hypothetical protein
VSELSNVKVIFTNEELEEIDAYSELTEGLNVDGIQIVCFKILSDLLHERIKSNDLNKKMLLTVYSQIKNSKSVFSQLPWFDSSDIEKMIPKILRYINEVMSTYT